MAPSTGSLYKPYKLYKLIIMIFNLSSSESLKRYRLKKKVEQNWRRALTVLIYIMLLVWIIVFIGKYLFGISMIIYSIVLGIALVWLWIDKYLRYKSHVFTISKSDNLADYLDDASVEYLLSIQSIAQRQKRSVDEGIMWIGLGQIEAGRYFLVRCGFASSDQYLSEITKYWQTLSTADTAWPQTLISAMVQAAALSSSYSIGTITIDNLLKSIIQISSLWQEILKTINLGLKDSQSIISWYSNHKNLSLNNSFWESEFSEDPIGRNWAFGYTPALQVYARDLTIGITGSRTIEIYGREKKIEALEDILSKSTGNNVLLVGDEGIGKKTIVLSLAQKIARNQAGAALQYKHVWELDTGRLLAGTNQSGEIVSRLKTILDEAVSAGDVILFIDNLSSLTSSGEKVGSINASAVLMPYLTNMGIQIIGTVNQEEYHNSIEANGNIAQVFQRIDIKEPDDKDTMLILENIIPIFEHKNEVVFTFPAVKKAVEDSQRYIHNIPMPQKAIELIDSAAISAQRQGISIISPQLIDKVISEKVDVPVGEASQTEKEKLVNLESVLHQHVIGQDEAIKAVSGAMRRGRAGLQKEGKPIGTFLFVGPTGVGKTETAKALAEVYFGSEKKMIRLDMSEYQTPESIERLIGSSSQTSEASSQGVLTKAIKDDPFTVILLDEIEKAHPNVLNLFLQVLDDGRLTDAAGRVVDFSNAIIIATSNAGAELIRQSIKGETPYDQLKSQLLEYLQTQNIFRPEFLNRFDAVVVYKSLTLDDLMKIVDLMINKVEANLKHINITLNVTPMAKQKLVQLGYNPVYGARPLWRVVQEEVEGPLSEKLLKNELQSGGSITIDEKDII